MVMNQKHKRSLIKTLTWRILATSATIVLVFLFTKNLAASFSVGIAEIIAKTLIYYSHERVWNRIKWGVE